MDWIDRGYIIDSDVVDELPPSVLYSVYGSQALVWGLEDAPEGALEVWGIQVPDGPDDLDEDVLEREGGCYWDCGHVAVYTYTSRYAAERAYRAAMR